MGCRWLAFGWVLWLFLAMNVQALDEGAAAARPAEKTVLVVAAKIENLEADHYLWAAEMTAGRLKGPSKVVEGGLVSALRYSRENPGTVRGIVEVVIDVYSYAEEVRITCLDPAGRPLWKEKVRANMGGSEEALARKMLERALGKMESHASCGK